MMATKLMDFQPSLYYLTYARHEPALWVEPKTRVRVPTLDAFGRDEHDRPVPAERVESREGETLYFGNPLSGPFCVHGAEPGDTFVCRILRIELTRATAASSFIPRFGAFTGEVPGKVIRLTPPLPARAFPWHLSADRTEATLRTPKSRRKKVTIPLHPFIGSIGVAPRYGRIETALTPGEYGGNMDCIETCEGATLYLPVFVRGGYLHLGDIHAAQGDGEVCGVALEISARVTMELDVIKGQALDWPRLEDRQFIMTVGNARPFEDALELAHREMTQWLVTGYGFDPDDAFQVLSQVGRVRVGNVVDPNYTAVVKFPKRLLR
jgi:acetamidase/formamidase